jgi:hypothetical protein
LDLWGRYFHMPSFYSSLPRIKYEDIGYQDIHEMDQARGI